jgi:CHAD domain-containing protein
LTVPKKGWIAWDEAASAGENARAHLPAIAGAYFQAGRKLLATSLKPVKMHGFRLETKRLRYTLELFRACYGPSLDQRLESLKDLQTLLGDINDCATALDVVGKALGPRSAEFRRLKRFLNARANRLSAAFRKHWREKFDAPGREEWWVGYLARRRRA